MPVNTKLTPIYKEITFWVMLALSLPGITALYYEAAIAIMHHNFEAENFYVGAFALPIVLYLGVGRQYARGKAVEAHGLESAAFVGSVDLDDTEEAPPLRKLLELDPDDRHALLTLDAAMESAANAEYGDAE